MNFIINPKTGKKISIYGNTYNKLLKDPNYQKQINDDTEFTKQIQKFNYYFCENGSKISNFFPLYRDF